MKCPHCGAENPDNGVFCQHCDKWIMGKIYIPPEPSADANLPAQTDDLKKSIPWKELAHISASFFVVCLTLLFIYHAVSTYQPSIIPNMNEPPYTAPVENMDGENLWISCDHAIADVRIDGKLAFIIDDTLVQTTYRIGKDAPSCSMDGSIGAYLTDDQKLLYIHEKQVTQIAENVTQFVLSATGNAIVYTVDKDTLCLYRAETGVSETISQVPQPRSISISPDGESVYYILESPYVSASHTAVLMRYQNEITSPIVPGLSNELILAVPDGGQWVYLKQGDELLIMHSDGTKRLLGEYDVVFDVSGNLITSSYIATLPSIHFSADQRQMLYYLEGASYLCVSGQESVRIANTYLTPISPSETNTGKDRYSISVTYPCKDLRQALFATTLPNRFLPTEASQEEPVFNNAVYTIPSYEFDAAVFTYAIYYLDSELVSKCLMENVIQFWLDPTGKALYFQDQDSILARMPKEDPEAIQYFGATPSTFVINPSDDCVYYLEDGGLYCIKNGQRQFFPMALTQPNLHLSITKDGTVYFYNEFVSYYFDGTGARDISLLRIIHTPSGQVYMYSTFGEVKQLQNGKLQALLPS